MIEPELIAHIAADVEGLPPDANPVASLRDKYPSVKFSRCDAHDLRGETRFAQLANYALYLVDTSNHCWRITGNPREAGGVVLAR